MPADPLSVPRWRASLVIVVIVLIAVAAVGLRWHATKIGLMSDDFAQSGMIAGTYPGEPYAPFDLYAFFRDDPETFAAHVEHGILPWWTSPDLHGTVMRPLASALLTLDHAIWPGSRSGALRAWHVHSLVWLGLLVIASGLALRRLLPPSMAWLALVILAADACYSTPLGWLANRCSLICATFGALALWAHVGWRRAQAVDPKSWASRGWLGLAIACVGLALAAGEYGLAAPIYIVCYELLGQAPPASVAASSWAARARRGLVGAGPALVVVLLWFALHRALGYGTAGSAVYVDPFTAPAAWLEVASERVPKLVSAALWSVPADTGDMIRRFGRSWVPWTLEATPAAEVYLRAHIIVASLMIAASLGLWLLVRTRLEPRERRIVGALGLGALIGLVPLSVAPVHSRLLVGAQLGASVVAAAIIVATVRGLRAWPKSGWPTRVAALVPVPLVAVLLYAQTVADLRWGRTYLRVLVQIDRSVDAAFEQGDLRGDDLGGRDVVVINAVSQTVGLHGQYWLASKGWPAPRSWRSLAMAEFALVALRVDDRRLELSSIQSAWLLSGAEMFFRRSGEGIAKGTTLAAPGLTVEVADDDGADHPTRLIFEFPVSLDDPRYLFLVSTPTGLRRWSVPAVKGRAIVPAPRLPTVALEL